jgi:hypothetical protein
MCGSQSRSRFLVTLHPALLKNIRYRKKRQKKGEKRGEKRQKKGEKEEKKRGKKR